MYPEKKRNVFYEDDKNPVVNELKRLYPEAIFASVSVEKIIGIFMNAQYIISGNGTFINGVIFFYSMLKVHYCPAARPSRSGCNVGVGLPNYITCWQNTEEQRKFMLEYNSTILPD